jgi:hypothetical protein
MPAASQTTPVEPLEDLAALVFLEWVEPPPAVWAGAPLELRLRFGVEASFLADRVLPLFRRDLDLPLQLGGGWLEPQRPLQLWPAPTPEVHPLSLALGDGVGAAAELTPSPRPGFRVFEVRQTCSTPDSGPLALAAPHLRLARATRFEIGFLGLGPPLDRVEGFVVGEPLEVSVLALPEVGRPAGFGGAVGQFEAQVRVAPQHLELGQSTQVQVRLEGHGNLGAQSAAPYRDSNLHRTTGQVARSSGESLGEVWWEVEYSCRPLETGAIDLPAPELAWFDPERGEYRVPDWGPLPVVVRPAAASTRVGEGTSEAPPRPANVDGAGSRRSAALAGGAALAAGLGLAWVWWRRRRPRSDTP